MSDTILLLRGVRCVGQFYLIRKEDRDAVEALPVGTEFRIEHEASNEHDKFAAVCMAEDIGKIGYLQKEVSPVCCMFANSGGAYEVFGKLVGRHTGKQPNPLVDVYARSLG